jgi:hypothetical protein
MTKKVLSTTPEKGWWKEKIYEIGINPWNHYITEMEGIREIGK